MNKFTEESAENLKKLISQVDKALYSWAKEQQIKKSKNTNGAEFELHCELKGEGTYITITIPDTVGYFPLNHALLDFIANEPENCHIFSVANEWL